MSGTSSSLLRDLSTLFKMRITVFVALACAAGFYLGAGESLSLVVLLHTVLGTSLLSAGACALNQVWEVQHDAQMDRTRERPLPSGRVSSNSALALGLSICATGLVELFWGVNALTAGLGLLSGVSYVLVYTPLKRYTHISTLVGGVPGAIPPVLGWAGATGRVDAGALALFVIVFLWQLPHFLAIARLYRDDYERAGFPVLPVADTHGAATPRAILVNCLTLLPAGALPSFLRVTGHTSLVVSLVLGLAFLGFGIDAAFRDNRGTSRRLLFASLAYLPALLLTLVLDKL